MEFRGDNARNSKTNSLRTKSIDGIESRNLDKVDFGTSLIEFWLLFSGGAKGSGEVVFVDDVELLMKFG